MLSPNQFLFSLVCYQHNYLHYDTKIKHTFTSIRFIAMMVKCQTLFLCNLYIREAVREKGVSKGELLQETREAGMLLLLLAVGKTGDAEMSEWKRGSKSKGWQASDRQAGRGRAERHQLTHTHR